jgi:hypothetical protein
MEHRHEPHTAPITKQDESHPFSRIPLRYEGISNTIPLSLLLDIDNSTSAR